MEQFCARTATPTVGFMALDLADPDVLDQLDDGIARGLRGVKLYPVLAHVDARDTAHDPFFVRVAEAGLTAQEPQRVRRRLRGVGPAVRRVPGAGDPRLRVGDLVRLVPNHACGTTNTWSQVTALRGGDVVAHWPISARH